MVEMLSNVPKFFVCVSSLDVTPSRPLVLGICCFLTDNNHNYFFHSYPASIGVIFAYNQACDSAS